MPHDHDHDHDICEDAIRRCRTPSSPQPHPPRVLRPDGQSPSLARVGYLLTLGGSFDMLRGEMALLFERNGMQHNRMGMGQSHQSVCLSVEEA